MLCVCGGGGYSRKGDRKLSGKNFGLDNGPSRKRKNKETGCFIAEVGICYVSNSV